MIKHIIISTLIVTSLNANKLSEKNIYSPGRLGPIELQHTSTGFLVNNQPVHNHNMDKPLRNIDPVARLKKIMVKYPLNYQKHAQLIGTTRPTLHRFLKGRTISLATYQAIEEYVTNKERE